MKDKRCGCFSNVSECTENDCEGCPARLKSEAEIRAEAIEEFAEAVKKKYPLMECDFGVINEGMHCIVDEIAMELKGE